MVTGKGNSPGSQLAGGSPPQSTSQSSTYSGIMRAGTGFGFTQSTLQSNPDSFADSLTDQEQEAILEKLGIPLRGRVSNTNQIQSLAKQAGEAGFTDLTSFANAENLWGQAGSPAKTPSANASQSAPPTGSGTTIYAPTTIDTTAANEQSAQIQVENALMAWGLDTPSLVAYSWSLVSDPSNHMDPGEVLNEIRKRPEYAARFPGIDNIIVGDGSPMTEANYLKHEDDIQTQLATAGVPTGMVDSAEIGKLIQNGVYGGTLKDRLDKGYTLVANAPPETTKLFKDWYGVSAGGLLMHFLDPSGKMTNKLLEQTQSVLVGTAAYDAGFGGPTGLSKQTAEQLAQQALVDPTNMTMNTYRTGFAKVAPLQSLEQSQTGQTGQFTVSQNQLISEAFPGMAQNTGSKADAEEAIKVVEGARAAGLSGGGGVASTSKGVVGAGSASSMGTGQA